jgi:hypothetical protein
MRHVVLHRLPRAGFPLVGDHTLNRIKAGDGNIRVSGVECMQPPATLVIALELPKDEFLVHRTDHEPAIYCGYAHPDDQNLTIDELLLHAVALHHQRDQLVAGAVAAGRGVFLSGGGNNGDVDGFARRHEQGFLDE